MNNKWSRIKKHALFFIKNQFMKKLNFEIVMCMRVNWLLYIIFIK